jgi:predicted AAA+ superfamily ATPase
MKDYSRWQKKALQDALQARRVVMLTGPRQCGKTTLVRQLISKNVEYRTLDDAVFRKAAEEDPHLFVEGVPENSTMIIDEVQKVPDLLPAIKKVVDQDNRPGQFLLTGSANIQSLPTVQESLAGRVANIRLRPLSQGEIDAKKSRFLDRAFAQSFRGKPPYYDRQKLIDLAFRGGFPEPVRLMSQKRKGWHEDYIEALMAHDLGDVAHIRQRDVMRELVGILAAWSSKFMDISKIGSGLAIERKTLTAYISALQSLYLIDAVPAWSKTDYDRVGKQAKLMMTDSGMMTALLGWRPNDLPLDPGKAGKLFETFVYHELSCQIDAADEACKLYHYRDREKREIDFLIEREDRALLGIEVKSGVTVKGRDFKHMKWFKENVAGKRTVVGLIMYAGEVAVPFGKDLWAVPYGYLW